MPQPIRQSSGATIFVPTAEEEINIENLKAIREEREKIEQTRRELEQELAEIRELKQSLSDK